MTLSNRLLPDGAEPRWLTPLTDVSAPQLGGAKVYELHYTGPRDWRNLSRNIPVTWRALRDSRPAAIVSTGAAPAIPAFLLAKLMGVECHYIESAARTAGPSLTGRLAARLGGVHCYTQWPQWAGATWRLTGSVFDGFTISPGPIRSIRTAVVMLGTQRKYGFRRLVEHLIDLFPPDVDVLWQTGSTDTDGLGIQAVPYLEYPKLREALAGADVVISHAGIGSTLDALSLGKCPVIVPREAAHGEHVDDHQGLIGKAIDSRHLAVVCSVDQLAFRHLEQAASAHVVSSLPPRLRLGGTLAEP